MEGTVVKVDLEKKYGFIRPCAPLPAEYTQKDVHFILRNIEGPLIQEGDLVRFKLAYDEGSKAKPRVQWVRKSFDGSAENSNNTNSGNVRPRTGRRPVSRSRPTSRHPEKTFVSEGHNTEKDRDKSLTTKMEGRVVNIDLEKKYGFIKPCAPLPTEYTRKDVHFKFEDIEGPLTQVGKLVQFILATDQASKTKPRAQRVLTKDDSKGSEENTSDTPVTSKIDGLRPDSKERQSRQNSSEAKTLLQKRNSEDKTSKEDRMNAAFQLTGKIVTLNDPYGFIKPFGSLPEKYENKNVFFHADKVCSGLFQLVPGDEVGFVLSGRDPGRPSALSVHLVECCRRSTETLEEYICQTKAILESMNVDDNGKVMDSSDHSYIVNIVSCPAVWKCVGNDPSISDTAVENLLLVLLYLDEKCEGLDQNFKSILDVLSRTHFMDVWKGRLLRYIKELTSKAQATVDTKYFLYMLIQRLPEKSKAVLHFVHPLVNGKRCNNQFLFLLLKECTKHSNCAIEDMEWDELPSVPALSEFLGNPADGITYMRPVKKKGPYETAYEYMDTYFRLLRSDGFGALCKHVKQFLKGKLDHRDMNVYNNVSLVGVLVKPSDASGIILAIKVNPHRPVKNWATSSNLMFGNLLALSVSGTFKDTIWATIVNRDEKLLKSKQIVMIELCSESNSNSVADCLTNLHQGSGGIFMVESPTYYRAYQPVLKALQKMDVDTLSFKEQLVDVKGPSSPSFIHKESTVNASVVYQNPSQNVQSLVTSFIEEGLTKSSTLDNSQKVALKNALQQNIAIIQGPPGTGKTFIGVKLVQLLLSMSTRPASPILVLTYKNHALDEFLKEILKLYPEEVVRVGGRSSDAMLSSCNLTQLKREERISETLYKEIQKLIQQQHECKEYVTKCLEELNKKRMLTVHTFIKNATESQMIEAFMHVNWNKEEVSIPVESPDGKSVCNLKVSNNMMTELVKEKKINKDFLKDNQHFPQIVLKHWLPDKRSFDEMERLSNIFLVSPLKLNTTDTKEELAERGDLTDEKDIEEIENERLGGIGKQSDGKYKLEDFLSMNNHLSQYDNIQLFQSAKQLLANVPTGLLEGIDDLWTLSAMDRVKLIQLWLMHDVDDALKILGDAIAEYERVCQAKNELENQHKVDIIRTRKVVGMTVTGASIHQSLLARLRPAIVMVEEAAEVLEPQLVAVLGNWVKQLILIGDHKQLRPSVENYNLVKDFNFDISMMERLINNDFPYSTLEYQNRMRPEFANLLKDIYPNLKSNLHRVTKNEAPKCLQKTMFFWTHQDKEKEERSYTNEGEAERAVQLSLFFVLQGYSAKQITILAAYKGQVALIRKMIRQAETSHAQLFEVSPPANQKAESVDQENSIAVSTIDQYQGDENDIVIISLVRSNNKGRAGFLKTINRRCVAQSRSRCCLVFLGNKETFDSVGHWNYLLKMMSEKECVGNAITLCCPKHRFISFESREGKDIRLDDFCRMKCSEIMDCGDHTCRKLCQPNHPHSVCKEEVEFSFSACLHPGKRRCHVPESELRCEKEVPMKFKKCGHVRNRLCYQREDQLPCLEKCGQTKPCHHTCHSACQSPHDHDICDEEIAFIHPICHHTALKKCSEDSGKVLCKLNVRFIFQSCGHAGKKLCHQSPDIKTCKEKCSRKIPECGHACGLKCGEPCDQKQCDECKRIEKALEEQLRKLEELERTKAREEANKKLEELRKQDISAECYRRELRADGDTAAEHLGVADKVRKYIQPDHKWFPDIKKIEKVDNLKLYERFLEAKTTLFDPARLSELKFHGTGKKGIEGITKNGFILPTGGGMYGNGIYFATDSSKSAQKMYTKGSNMLLLCDVLLGKTKTVEKAIPHMTNKILKKEKYDSLFAKRGTRGTGGVLFDEFVVYNPDQALPKYIIHYESSDWQKSLKSDTLESKVLLGGKPVFKVYNIKAKRDISFDDQLEIHYRLAESQFRRLDTQKHDIVSVDYYINSKLVEKFKKKTNDMEKAYGDKPEGKCIFAFHGTKEENIPGIMKENFRLDKLASNTGNKGKFGAGIYFSEFPHVSSGYGKALLLCKVLPGKSYDCTELMTGSGLKSGYDSHRFQRDDQGRGKELVIFDVDQILPCYVINLK